jgi:RNase H-fold protein (predicted Holliday junction resolvase)
VLAIDPGRSKCGLAVVSQEGVLVHAVVGLKGLRPELQRLVERFAPDALVIGGGTGSEQAVRAASGLGLPVHRVDERLTTLQARSRYFKDHPPRGWRRLLPRGLLVPPEPYDDYAAVLLGERFFQGIK